ncbi:hypothetical protein M514_06532 [Trichuris suis]|uniref:Uncharacterized protein n=1 Tax=Trichuris suis TaxID=68888 RepID=A0A085N2W3_9BILA|nr:hypothetical protein M513_06532 [Trichuris suis]KFD63809.1 hypothetical protein M514_06532 [Trichuris suis]
MLPSDSPRPDSENRGTLKADPGRTFAVGRSVMTKNFAVGDSWTQGTIIERLGNMHYPVRTAKGVLQRHQNQLRPHDSKLGLEEMQC